MSDEFARIKAIVIRAQELSGEARAAYLTAACGQEPRLRAEVETLLAHALDTPSILGSATRIIRTWVTSTYRSPAS